MDLTQKKCVACEGIGRAMTLAEARALLKRVPGWTLAAEGVLSIRRDFEFTDFVHALEFVNKVACLAEGEGHHPDLLIHSWNRVRLTLSTHALQGLTENDFIVAAKINALK
ncbi:MAG: 4a-hydroxytetrahydrobiopterin dehydratase [Candidatus Aenigmarchaeota archaeon]|nr:4a-hydroxytetrahydrobiopterin dehydratase [Candidatus Aenigmarchaeota archaeon]